MSDFIYDKKVNFGEYHLCGRGWYSANRKDAAEYDVYVYDSSEVQQYIDQSMHNRVKPLFQVYTHIFGPQFDAMSDNEKERWKDKVFNNAKKRIQEGDFKKGGKYKV